MERNVYAVKDRLNGFLSPFLDMSDASAKRGFLHSMHNAQPDSLFFTHPEDYSLYKLGAFETESGKLISLPTPQFICDGYTEVYEDETKCC